MSKSTQPVVKGLLWNGLITMTITTMILGCYALLGRCFSRLMHMLQVTAMWVMLLPIATGFLGAASNQLVLFANHDTFPVMVNLAKAEKFASTDDAKIMEDGTLMLDDTHCLMTSRTHLNLLADIFDFKSSIMSVGDLLIDLSGWLWGFCPLVWGFEVSRRLLQ